MSNYIRDLTDYLLAVGDPNENETFEDANGEARSIHWLFPFPRKVNQPQEWDRHIDELAKLLNRDDSHFILTSLKEPDSICITLPKLTDDHQLLVDETIDRVFESFITIYPTGSKQPANPKWLLDYPKFQIRARGRSGKHLEAYLIMQKVRDRLLGVCPTATGIHQGQPIVIGFPNADPTAHPDGLRNYWDSITMDTDILTLDVDSKNRISYVFNICAIVEPRPHAGSNREPLGSDIAGQAIQQPQT